MSLPTHTPDGIEIMYEGEDGWTDWIHPTPGYKLQCCDCNLIHDMEFAIVPRADDGALNEGENDHAVVIFRAKRA